MVFAREEREMTGRVALFVSLGFIILMWIIKVIHNTFYIDVILAWASSMQTFSAYALAYGTFTVIAVSLLLRLSKDRYKDIGFNREGLFRQIGIGVLFGILIFVLMNLAIDPIINALLPKESIEGTDLSTLFKNILFLPIWIVLAVFKSGFSEELWRIFTLTRFEKLYGKSGLLFALIAGSVIFGFGHFYQGTSGLIVAATRGLIYALVYLRKRRAFEAISAHATFDLINITLGYILY
ncbi:CPBP family intramembrane glutamic endopeptidase [Chloroflexota bacterium]